MSGGGRSHRGKGVRTSPTDRQESPDRGWQHRPPKAGPAPPLLAEEFGTAGSVSRLRYRVGWLGLPEQSTTRRLVQAAETEYVRVQRLQV